jgi:hypothetical protein
VLKQEFLPSLLLFTKVTVRESPPMNQYIHVHILKVLARNWVQTVAQTVPLRFKFKRCFDLIPLDVLLLSFLIDLLFSLSS